MADIPLHVLSLCSGTGMLDEGVRLAAPGSRVVGYVEREAFAAAVLLERMEDAALEPAPVWCGNLEDFDAREWRGAVDCVTAGFPCQPWSGAGKRLGEKDERWIWPAIAGIIRSIEPPIVFLENVPGLVTGRGLNCVLRDLAALGFDAEWCSLSAADVGATHLRERIFILAFDAIRGRGILRESSEQRERLTDGCDKEVGHAGQRHGELLERLQRVSESAGASEPLADGEGSRRREFLQERGPEGRTSTGGTGANLADSYGTGRQQISGSSSCDEGGDAGRSTHTDHFAAGSRADVADNCGPRLSLGVRYERTSRGDATDERGETLADSELARRQASGSGRQEYTGREPQPGCSQLADDKCDGRGQCAEDVRAREPIPPHGGIFAPGPSDPRWTAILAREPWLSPVVEPGIRCLVDGHAVVVDEYRADQLRAIGNGVVALQAAVAFAVLARRILK